jgi:thiosulfate/3-mercaptopyruvate sulfurtransferase
MSENVLITPIQLKQMTETLHTVIIDTRSPDAYGKAHIPGAVNVHDIFTL